MLVNHPVRISGFIKLLFEIHFINWDWKANQWEGSLLCLWINVLIPLLFWKQFRLRRGSCRCQCNYPNEGWNTAMVTCLYTQLERPKEFRGWPLIEMYLKKSWQKTRVQNTACTLFLNVINLRCWHLLSIFLFKWYNSLSLHTDHIPSLSQQTFSLPRLDLCCKWCFTFVIRKMLKAKKNKPSVLIFVLYWKKPWLYLFYLLPLTMMSCNI